MLENPAPIYRERAKVAAQRMLAAAAKTGDHDLRERGLNLERIGREGENEDISFMVGESNNLYKEGWLAPDELR